MKPPKWRNKRPLVIPAIAALALISLFVIKLVSSQKPSSAILSSRENSFKANFIIQNNDRENFSKFLQNLNLPQNISKGFQFKLDATSSARLAFLTPLSANLDIAPDNVQFTGSTDNGPTFESFTPAILRVPAAANLIVAANDFKNFARDKFNLPNEYENWLANNITSPPGQYLIVFGQNSDFAIVVKNKPDFEALKNIQIKGNNDAPYKQEVMDNVTLHLIKITTKEQNKTYAFFQVGDFAYFVSSYEGAQELLKVEKAQTPGTIFKPAQNGKIVFAMEYQNPGSLPKDFAKTILANANEPPPVLTKVRKINLTLKTDSFSGLISVK